MTNQQGAPEALRLAELLELAPEDGIEPQTAEDAAAELLRQHARIAELEAQLESIAASTGSEPVAWLVCSVNSDGTLSLEHAAAWQEAAHEHINDAITEHGIDEAASWVVRPAYAHPSPPEGMVGGWIALPGALPEPGTPVLLDIGKKYPIRAMWTAKHTVEASLECPDDWAEYDEATDTYYCPEGWYEWNECEETHWAVNETPSAWAPLPPTTSAGSGKGE